MAHQSVQSTCEERNAPSRAIALAPPYTRFMVRHSRLFSFEIAGLVCLRLQHATSMAEYTFESYGMLYPVHPHIKPHKALRSLLVLAGVKERGMRRVPGIALVGELYPYSTLLNRRLPLTES